MADYQTTKSREMQLMLEPVIAVLQTHSITDLCEKAQAVFREADSTFELMSMGEKIEISYPDFVIRQELDMWHHLTLLRYLDTADGSALSENWIDLTEMRGGLSRGAGFNKDIATMFARNFRGYSAEDFRKACVLAGGTITDGKADVCAVIPYCPRFPVKVSFWEGDDEFAPSGKALVNANAEHYLTLEAAGGACATVVMRIAKNLNS